MPIGISFLIAFLYFIQLFTLQEKIQAGITNLGLNLAKTAYIYEDYFVRKIKPRMKVIMSLTLKVILL